jgi:YgiT-type zinc finger domain-containing protein
MNPYDECIYCGGKVEEKMVTLDYRYHGRLFIMEGVRAGVCGQCGEKFLKAEVAKRLEKLAREGAAPVKTVTVPVLRV